MNLKKLLLSLFLITPCLQAKNVPADKPKSTLLTKLKLQSTILQELVDHLHITNDLTKDISVQFSQLESADDVTRFSVNKTVTIKPGEFYCIPTQELTPKRNQLISITRGGKRHYLIIPQFSGFRMQMVCEKEMKASELFKQPGKNNSDEGSNAK